MAGYYTLRSGKGKLKGYTIEAGGAIEPDDATAAEEAARETIDELLGKRWSTDPAETPLTIRRLAHWLAAARLLQDAHASNTDPHSIAEKLEQKVLRELAKIRRNRQGIKLRDGSWDPKYPGSNNVEEGTRSNGVEFIY